ncbi:MAG: Fic family protein [Dyadobacter sp.]|uniref:Fic family protein n=1 Tax=Dyadobacter sp. TaxID=1914288 RepID=UPI003263459B
MATPSEKLADSLEILHKLQSEQQLSIIQARHLSRTHKERLLKTGFIQEIIKGWYMPSRPDEVKGDSTSWYTSFWDFCSEYLNNKFGQDWILSPEQSLSIYGANWMVPRQLLVRSPNAHNNTLNLPYDTSIFDIRLSLPAKNEIQESEGLRIYSLSSALVAASPVYFTRNPMDARTALSMVRDASDLLTILLDGGHSIIAGRLAGAFRNIANDRIADEIVETMQAAGYDVRENDPFNEKLKSVFSFREVSPYVNRIKLMWEQMREVVIRNFPKPPGIPKNVDSYLKNVDEVFVTDAYHSLSIEGYRVTPELIEGVRKGEWNPERNEADNDQKNALAARGYWQAFQAVKESIAKILDGNNSGDVLDSDHRIWYRELFSPSVAIGLLKASDLAGYRNGQVYIRRSMHVPLNRDAVRDTMPVFFDLLRQEKEAAVRVVLGHFIFVYIHPYMDGNGRIGRFLMNAMLASGGYPWTVVPLGERNNYMQALERASVNQDITEFAQFLSRLVQGGLEGKALPDIPKSP